MVVIPAGAYWRGTDSNEETAAAARPRHRVNIPTPIAVARTETTVAAFQRFISATGHTIKPGCWHHPPTQEWELNEQASWLAPGYAQTKLHPVTCISWRDATAYARWLSGQTGSHYRLPSEAEFEYFDRAGIEEGDPASPEVLYGPCSLANGADQSSQMAYAYDCDDGFSHAAPVGSFPANAFGLHDTRGNLWEYTADCWNPDYAGSWRTWFQPAPTDGSTWTRGHCGTRVIRGGSYLSSVDNLRVYQREMGSGKLRLNRTGFRLVREL